MSEETKRCETPYWKERAEKAEAQNAALLAACKAALSELAYCARPDYTFDGEGVSCIMSKLCYAVSRVEGDAAYWRNELFKMREQRAWQADEILRLVQQNAALLASLKDAEEILRGNDLITSANRILKAVQLAEGGSHEE